MGWYLLQLLPALGLPLLIGCGIAWARARSTSLPVRVNLALALLLLLPVALPLGWVRLPFPASEASTRPHASVRLPSDQPLIVIWGGNRVADNHHAVVPDQRWAYDLVVAPALIDSEHLDDYGCYGTPVLAPVDGTVSSTRDDLPDSALGVADASPEDALGNHVVLKLPSDTFVVLAHLKPGSVRVSPGDGVREGQALGACGNSGNSSEPHIHIHHQRQDPAEFPLNFAEGLPLYFRDHDGDPMPRGGLVETPEGLRPRASPIRHVAPGA